MGLGLSLPVPTDLTPQEAPAPRAGPPLAHHSIPPSSFVTSHSPTHTPGSAAFGEWVSRSLTAHSCRPPCFLACRPRQGLTHCSLESSSNERGTQVVNIIQQGAGRRRAVRAPCNPYTQLCGSRSFLQNLWGEMCSKMQLFCRLCTWEERAPISSRGPPAPRWHPVIKH